ncbi:MAG: undecaprenyl/decaprenyl-phosphate alpha-N-acetylglucosaminyl 1-phosphate transferase [Saprospiraceae bacterium]|nr:MAG: undecaprenyl/decaprenyl-phosphate alpha-N-acetylglucosaminyl 1-phosphate transferase [Saprospiraceae bacterium]
MNPAIYVLFGFLISLGTSYLLTRTLIDVAKKKGLLDANNCLKQHSEKVCALGGVGIFSAFWLATFLAGNGFAVRDIPCLFAGAFILFLAGVKDDLTGMLALKRLALQIGVASLLFYSGIRISALPGMDGTLPLLLSYLLTTLFIGAVLNAYNFIDGINGLAGGLGVISGLTFFGLFLACGEIKMALMAVSLTGALLGFLWFNFDRARVFMGDNGSTFMGLMLAWFSIVFLSERGQAEVESFVSPVFFMAILFVPLADMAKVVLGRLWRKSSPFRGDRTHIHHLMAAHGFGPAKTCWLLYGWQIIVIIFSLFFLPQNAFRAIALLALPAGLPYFSFYLYDRAKKRKRPSEIRPSENEQQLESIYTHDSLNHKSKHATLP